MPTGTSYRLPVHTVLYERFNPLKLLCSESADRTRWFNNGIEGLRATALVV